MLRTTIAETQIDQREIFAEVCFLQRCYLSIQTRLDGFCFKQNENNVGIC